MERRLKIISRELNEVDGYKTIQSKYKNISNKTIKRIICSYEIYNVIEEKIKDIKLESIGFIAPNCSVEVCNFVDYYGGVVKLSTVEIQYIDEDIFTLNNYEYIFTNSIYVQSANGISVRIAEPFGPTIYQQMITKFNNDIEECGKDFKTKFRDIQWQAIFWYFIWGIFIIVVFAN